MGATFWFKICGWPRNVLLLENPQFLHFFGPFFFQIHQKNVGKPIPGRKSTLGTLRGDKTRKSMFFVRFSRFVAPE